MTTKTTDKKPAVKKKTAKAKATPTTEDKIEKSLAEIKVEDMTLEQMVMLQGILSSQINYLADRSNELHTQKYDEMSQRSPSRQQSIHQGLVQVNERLNKMNRLMCELYNRITEKVLSAWCS